MKAYKELTQLFKKLHNFNHLSAIASWDASANMPSGGAAARGDAMAELDLHTHALITDPKLATLFADAEAEVKAAMKTATEAGEAAQQKDAKLFNANLREMKRKWESETKLPAELVEEKAKLTTEADQVWRKARAANDFKMFEDCLTRIFALSRRMGEKMSENHPEGDLSPYEALMQQYEPGMRKHVLDKLFGDIKTWLPGLIQEVMKKQAAQRDDAEAQKAAAAVGATLDEFGAIQPVGPFTADDQKALGLEVMKDVLHFNFDHGRLDVSPHPFCGGVPTDVRITTRYDTSECTSALMGIVHETGHARYEQNRDQELLDQPVSEARGMGVHESQSLLHEMQLGREPAFVNLLLPLMQKHLVKGSDEKAKKINEAAFTAENMRRITHIVKPGAIRVDADELTYALHVIMRYEIERTLVDGDGEEKIEIASLSEVWQKKMKEYLGVTLKPEENEKNGILQDVHWSMCGIGYFPSYSLGAIFAAQFMAEYKMMLGKKDGAAPPQAMLDAANAADATEADKDKLEMFLFDEGDKLVSKMITDNALSPLFAWLSERVWTVGSKLETAELLYGENAKLEDSLNAKWWRRHLERRYLGEVRH